MCQGKPCAASTANTSHAVEQHRAKFVALQRLNEIETARCSVLLGRPHSLRLRASPKIPAATNGMGASVAIKALLESTEDLLLSPTTTSALSLRRPTDAHRRNSPPSPRAQAAQAPDPRTKSRIPTVRMSRVSVPDPCGKNQPGARNIATPTPTAAARTVGQWRGRRPRIAGPHTVNNNHARRPQADNSNPGQYQLFIRFALVTDRQARLLGRHPPWGPITAGRQLKPAPR